MFQISIFLFILAENLYYNEENIAHIIVFNDDGVLLSK